jgi:hypothetical protein
MVPLLLVLLQKHGGVRQTSCRRTCARYKTWGRAIPATMTTCGLRRACWRERGSTQRFLLMLVLKLVLGCVIRRPLGATTVPDFSLLLLLLLVLLLRRKLGLVRLVVLAVLGRVGLVLLLVLLLVRLGRAPIRRHRLRPTLSCTRSRPLRPGMVRPSPLLLLLLLLLVLLLGIGTIAVQVPATGPEEDRRRAPLMGRHYSVTIFLMTPLTLRTVPLWRRVGTLAQRSARRSHLAT